MAATSTHGTLWSSWVVKGPSHRIFFSGGSGHFDGFKAIGAAHGPFDLTLIKIGACDAAWQDIQGTFNLAFHAWNAPAEDVVAAASARGVAIAVPRPGQWVEPTAPPTLDPWWR